MNIAKSQIFHQNNKITPSLMWPDHLLGLLLAIKVPAPKKGLVWFV